MLDSSGTDALGNLLRYGPLGANLALLIVAFWGLISLHKLVSEGKLSASSLAALSRQQYALLGSAVLLAGLGYWGQIRGSTHEVAFALSPTKYETDKLAPHVKIIGGSRIVFEDGSGKDSVNSARAYQIDVGELVERSAQVSAALSQFQLKAAAQANVDGR